VNGKQDFLLPYETNQKPFFGRLGDTGWPIRRSSCMKAATAIAITRPDLLGEILAWFDHYLGPVQEKIVSQ
jgi:hypothetical protein